MNSSVPFTFLRQYSSSADYRLSSMPESPSDTKLTSTAPLLSPITHMTSVSPDSLPAHSVNMSRPPSTSSSASGRCRHYLFRAGNHAFRVPTRFPAFQLKCPTFLVFQIYCAVMYLFSIKFVLFCMFYQFRI